MKVNVLLAILYFIPLSAFASDYQAEIDEFFAYQSGAPSNVIIKHNITIVYLVVIAER